MTIECGNDAVARARHRCQYFDLVFMIGASMLAWSALIPNAIHGNWWFIAVVIASWCIGGCFGFMTPTVNCLVFALYERTKNRGAIHWNNDKLRFELRTANQAIYWIPAGWRWRRRTSNHGESGDSQ